MSNKIKPLTLELVSMYFVDLPIWNVCTIFIIINIFNMYQIAPQIRNIFGADLVIAVVSICILLMFMYYEIKARHNLQEWLSKKRG